MMGGIYNVRGWDGPRFYDTPRRLREDWLRDSSNIKVVIAIILEASMLVLLMVGIL
jgi:hypothetical protein